MPRWIRRQVEKGEDARALAVANHLNIDPASPWFGKIRMANDEDEGATINQKSFITSLRRHIFSANNPYLFSGLLASEGLRDAGFQTSEVFR
jgi:hypothetical protein